MNQSEFLITGGAGSTAANVIRALVEQGRTVRALVKTDDKRATDLRRMGVDVVVGDMLDLEILRQSIMGIKTAYFVFPIQPGLIEATSFFAQAAIEAGVGSIINMSQISARSDAASFAARNHWVAEQILDRTGIDVTHLRPTFFAQWIIYPWFLETINEQGEIALPFGNGRHAPVAAEDQSRLITAILLNPAPHAGKTYPLHGPVEMSQAEIAGVLSEALGRPIVYRPTSLDEYRMLLKRAELNDFLVQHLCEVAIDYQNGIFSGTNDVIEKITGKPPMTQRQFVELYRSSFR